MKRSRFTEEQEEIALFADALVQTVTELRRFAA